jgi:membrane protease YdiL (CAAX protease family)
MHTTGFLHVDGNVSLRRAPAVARGWVAALVIVILAQWIEWQGVGLSQLLSGLYISNGGGAFLGSTEEAIQGAYTVTGVLSLLVPGAILVAVVFFLSLRVDGRGANSLGLNAATVPFTLIWSVVALIAAVPLIVAIIANEPRWSEIATGAAILTPVTIVQAGAEEVLFRGVILGSLCARYGARAGVFISAVLIGAWHLQFGQPLTDAVLKFASTFVFGATAAIVTLHYANLGPALALHVVWNVVGYLKVASDQWASSFWTAWINSAFTPWTYADLLSGDAVRYLAFPLLLETLLILGVCRITLYRVFAPRRAHPMNEGSK